MFNNLFTKIKGRVPEPKPEPVRFSPEMRSAMESISNLAMLAIPSPENDYAAARRFAEEVQRRVDREESPSSVCVENPCVYYDKINEVLEEWKPNKQHE